MRKIDSGLLGRIKEYVEDYCGNCGYGPSVREIASAHDIAVGTAQKYLAILLQDGQLSRGKRGYQSTDCASAVTDTMRVPILGTIPCGPLAEEEEYLEGYIRLPKAFLGGGKWYLLTADGDSMIDAGIGNGDLVLIKAAEEAEPGDIVVALVENRVTLKRLRRNDAGQYYLHPENQSMSDIYVEDLQIQGIAVKVLKDLV